MQLENGRGQERFLTIINPTLMSLLTAWKAVQIGPYWDGSDPGSVDQQSQVSCWCVFGGVDQSDVNRGDWCVMSAANTALQNRKKQPRGCSGS